MTQTTNSLVSKIIAEAIDGVRIRHCGRKMFSENPVWRGLRVDKCNDKATFLLAHDMMDEVRAAFATQNERGTWHQLAAEEAWPIYHEAFIADRYHGFIFESDYHENYSRGEAA